MKKIYILSLIALCFLLTQKSFGQEMLYGGNMNSEDEEEWSVSFLNQDADNTVEYEFGYTDTKPLYGKDGCLYVSGTNTGDAGGNLTNVMFYQPVTLERGLEYTFDAAYKDMRSSSFWCEVYVGGNEPEEGSDYGGDQGAVLLSGFKSTNWESNCPADEFDGTFQEDACIPGTTNMVYFEGEGDTMVYFGFRMGIWDGDGQGLSFELYMDNISLMGPEGSNTSARSINEADMNVYPTQFTNELNVSTVNRLDKIEIINIAGQNVYSMQSINSNNSRLNVEHLNKGLYTLKIYDENGLSGSTKIIKQ